MCLWWCIYACGTIAVAELSTGRGNNGIKVIFKSCAPFTSCKSKINNTHINNAKCIDVVMSMYELLQSSDNYSKTSGSLWQYYRDEPGLNSPGNSALFTFKQKIKGSTGELLKCH